ncbi:tetratricopeptide repeat protein [Rubripirellula amarantea]|uniref:Tetratricopeptide repeat protein n=1 Tax=Rubripirellula amarantea TaxID=2527999 RepID=A0A5C5WST8_9BACT|nr:tetratricopeptide repeat protein [Rubripirellula amarantea]TWT53219.1 tetratricopeptide repeat protein [Rubripirellula amarantea]
MAFYNRLPSGQPSQSRQTDCQSRLTDDGWSGIFIQKFWVWVGLSVLATCQTGCQWAAGGQNATGARLYEQGQYSAALQQFQKVIATDPENADGYYNLAATNHRLGNQRGDSQQITQAEALYNQCLDHDPNHVECHRGLAVLLVDTGRPDRAFALMKNWAAQNPQFAEPRIELARLYEEVSDPSTALKYLEDAVQKDPNNSRAWLALGRLREQTGDLNQALQNYQRSLALNGSQPMAAERIASLSRQISANFEAVSAQGGTQIASQPGFGSGMVRRYKAADEDPSAQ